jgi:SAM-dependent methyltransferase
MEKSEGAILDFYTSDDYIAKNPSLHEEDSGWKVGEIIPMVDRCMSALKTDEINLLDVGGGTGEIMRQISAHIAGNHRVKVNKFALDLSPGMLKIQKTNNPDIIGLMNDDIRYAPLKDKQIDLTLMIDTLEHIPDPARALSELKRISKYVIFKVPLENNLHLNLMNVVTGGKARREIIENLGHVNVFDFKSLRKSIESHNGTIVKYHYANVFEYYVNSSCRDGLSPIGKLINRFAARAYHVSPSLSSAMFTDFMMALVKCY